MSEEKIKSIGIFGADNKTKYFNTDDERALIADSEDEVSKRVCDYLVQKILNASDEEIMEDADLDAIEHTRKVVLDAVAKHKEQKERTCKWSFMLPHGNYFGSYNTQCSNAFQFIEGDLQENIGFKYCPYCGGRIV